MGISDVLQTALKGAAKGAGDYLQGKKSSSDSSEGPGIGKELGEKAKSMKQAGKALSSPSSDSDSKPAPASAPAPMKPAKGSYGSQPGEKSPSQMNASYPGLPKMHKGGMVKKSGPHLLLKGEAVLNKKDTKKLSALGNQSKPSPSVGEPDGMSIDKLDDGSFHIQHRNNGPEKDGSAPKPPQKFSARNVKHLVRHVRQAFGGGQQDDDDGMAEPSSFANGGVVQKGGMAKVHAGEKVIPAPKGKPVQSPDVYIGGAPKAKPITRAPDRSLDPSVRDREQSLT